MFNLPNVRCGLWVAALLAAPVLANIAPSQVHARELSTDRPDQTESPYSVEAGRYQAEFQLLSAASGPDGGGTAWQFVGLNLKRGLSRSTDLQLVLSGLESIPTPGGRNHGTGDATLRLKWNARGNDAEGLAWGLMPFVSFPTGSESFTAGGFEGGLILPVAFPLSGETGMGLMLQGDIVRDAVGSSTHLEAFATATVSRALAGSLGGFIELAARFRPEDEGPREVMLDLGTTYGVGEDVQWDAGVQCGLSEGAEDLRAFLGFTIRR
ncbi:MAG TPA: transporter [Candidatus Eisenbacteria bacterium]|nr:transporter [Candidatus Eisenbacteria bacterium]